MYGDFGKDKLNPNLKYKIEKILKYHKSPKQMLKGNVMILKILHYNNIPELATSFCLGVVFSEIATALDTHFYPTAIEYASLKEANQMYLAFVRGEYE